MLDVGDLSLSQWNTALEDSGEGASRQCKRVTAISLEVARLSQLPRHLEPLIERVAILHRSKDFGSIALRRLAAEMELVDPQAAICPQPDLAELESILLLLDGKPAPGAAIHCRQVADIVRMCTALDEQLVAQPLDYKPIDTILDELHTFAVFEGFDPDLVNCLRQLRCEGPGLTSNWARLPVQAKIAQTVIRCLGSEDECEISDVEKLAASDPVLAGALIQVANSTIYSPYSRISRLREAISYMGTVTARKVLLAASVRPLFASAGLRRLWTHSLQMALLCSALGKQSGIVGSEEGLLIGLVHDVGSLAVQTLSGATLERYSRLVEKGCPPVYVEQSLFGRDHGEIGSEILSLWSFPARIVEAVRFHHQSERSESPVASMLYLAEFWSGQDEDLPSFVRIRECTVRTGISIESLATAHNRASALNVLGSVA
jgi:HD-like signal output (HDOD) protein